MAVVTYSIPNIHCGHCVHTVKSEVSEIKGVISVEADFNNRTATIKFEAPATEEKIKQLLSEINYPVVN